MVVVKSMKLEKYLLDEFNLTPADLFNLHNNDKISLNELSKNFNIIRQSLSSLLRRHGFKTRSVKDACALTKNKGKNHWAYGLTKETNDLFLEHSKRMKLKNPTRDIETRSKAAVTRARYFKKNLWPQEVSFKQILDKYSIKYEFQYPIGPYIIDFFILDKNTCIEIDSTSKWGTKRRNAAKVKDEYLFKLGYKMIRLNKNNILKDSTINILNANNIIG